MELGESEVNVLKHFLIMEETKMTKQNPFFKMVKGDTAFIYKDKSEDNAVYGVKITNKKFLIDYIIPYFV